MKIMIQQDKIICIGKAKDIRKFLRLSAERHTYVVSYIQNYFPLH